MNQGDDNNEGAPADTLLLFNFSRAQNVVKFWKFRSNIKQMLFMDTDPAVVLLINQ